MAGQTLVPKVYDCAIIGGGPAGLSAAIYMGRFLRKTVVIDDIHGRSTYAQVNENYLGFPNGIAIRELRALGEQQAARFGVEFERDTVQHLQLKNELYLAQTRSGKVIQARTVILCTGVQDIWPGFENAEAYVGKTLFWCIVCDGFRTAGKRLVLFGKDDDAATTAVQFLPYTKDIKFVVPTGELDCSAPKIRALDQHGIEVVEGRVASVEGTPEKIEAVCLANGRRLECDLIFGLLGCIPDVQLAVEVGADLTSGGYVRIDNEGYTTVPGFFCAGDVSGIHAHQVSAAVHEGAEAAMTANYYLYSSFQKVEFGTPEAEVQKTLLTNH